MMVPTKKQFADAAPTTTTRSPTPNRDDVFSTSVMRAIVTSCAPRLQYKSVMEPERPRMLLIFIQTPRGVIRLRVVMDFHQRALRRRKPFAHMWTSWRGLFKEEIARLVLAV